MAESVEPGHGVPFESSIPGAPLASILLTEELRRRPSRPPEFEKENSALAALVSALADSPRTIRQTLADKVLEVLHADSAGLSLLTKDETRFYWAAIAGAWRPHLGGGTPRTFGPCGDVLDQNTPMLFAHWERRYPYLRSALPLADERLLVPFYVNGKGVGTIWAIAHDKRRRFDAEDLRLLESLGRFASAAYRALESIDNLKSEIAAREEAESAVPELANGLETQVRVRTQELERSTRESLAANKELEREIAERKRAEQGLRRSEAFLVEGQRLGQVGSFSWRVATDEVTWSAQLYRIYEFEIGVPVTLELIRTRVHPGDFSLLERMKMVDQARGGADDFEWQYRLMMPDHSIKYLHAVAHATRDQDGQLEYIAAVQDVTARRLSEEALDKARAQLAQVARATSLGVLTASIAHELNQPLCGIITNANTCLRMLAADSPDVDGARETARRTIRDGNRASEVIARLRALFTKKDSTTELVDLNEATREVIALSASALQRNRVILRQELAEDLPPVVGDRVQLQQVVLNILLNASDAMSGIDDRPRELMISTARDDGECLRVVVQDAGVGFDPEAADKLFEAFYTTKSSGMGIGLSVSRSIIERHHGRIWAARNDGPGDLFIRHSLRCTAHAGVGKRDQGLLAVALDGTADGQPDPYAAAFGRVERFETGPSAPARKWGGGVSVQTVQRDGPARHARYRATDEVGMTTMSTGNVTRGPSTMTSASASRSIEGLTMPDVASIVFVVDDDVSVRESLELLIKSAGWQPETFVSAQEFLSHPHPVVPCCLVLDVTLPGLSGLELQKQLAERGDMPIIFITGHGDVPMSVQAMKAGAVEFLTKPFKDDVLLNAIRGAIERSCAALRLDAEMRALRNCYEVLTPREREVMALVVSGLLNKQVGGELGISEITVKAHRGQVMRKMKADSLADLVTMAARLHLAPPRKAASNGS